MVGFCVLFISDSNTNNILRYNQYFPVEVLNFNHFVVFLLIAQSLYYFICRSNLTVIRIPIRTYE